MLRDLHFHLTFSEKKNIFLTKSNFKILYLKKFDLEFEYKGWGLEEIGKGL